MNKLFSGEGLLTVEYLGSLVSFAKVLFPITLCRPTGITRSLGYSKEGFQHLIDLDDEYDGVGITGTG